MRTASQLHRAMFQAIEDHDLDALRATYHPDYIYMSSDGVEQKGPDAGIEVAETYLTAFPDLVISINHQYEPSPEISIIEFRAKGTHEGDLEGIAPTGKRVEMAVCNVVEVMDDRIIREREYFDTMAMMQQLGVMD